MRKRITELTLFPLLGVIMYVSKVAMEALPNMHLLAMLITVYTVIFRKKALIPIYIFVYLTGLFGGFGPWWIPYLYIWTVLWGAVMLLPRNMNPVLATGLYMAVCAIHGFLFGVMYAPVQAVIFGLSFEETLAWIGGGLYFDIAHGLFNLVAATLVSPLIAVMKKALKTINYI